LGLTPVSAACAPDMPQTHYDSDGISRLQRFYRANLINSITGYKPANLIATIAADGRTNVAIFTSVVHLGADPPLLGFVMRPPTVPRHTFANLRQNGCCTINHVHREFYDRAHYTSAKFAANESEFATCHLREEYKDGFAAPYVGESPLQIGARLVDELPIAVNGTIFVILALEHLYINDAAIADDGNIDLEMLGSVAVSGLESYYTGKKLATMPYARPENTPDWPGKRDS
jgi:flavin reductase (DIM6/NTAB) family NADH-FMN oxidoreductase RutF